jgi:hypothetical protein
MNGRFYITSQKIILTLLLLIIGCSEGTEDSPVRDVSHDITIEIRTSTDTEVRDGTPAYFARAGEDTLKYPIKNGMFSVGVNALESATITGNIGTFENEGYEAANKRISFSGKSNNNHLDIEGKEHIWNTTIGYQQSGTPVEDLDITIDEVTKATNGEGLVEHSFTPKINRYNEPQETHKAVTATNKTSTSPQVEDRSDNLTFTENNSTHILHYGSNPEESFTLQAANSTPNASINLTTTDFESLAQYMTNSTGNLSSKVINMQLDTPIDAYVIMNAENAIADTIPVTLSDGTIIDIENINRMIYDVDVTNTPEVASGVLKENGSTLETSGASNNVITFYQTLRQLQLDGVIELTAEGYDSKTITKTLLPGPSTLDGTMNPSANPEESITVSANNSTKNASITVKNNAWETLAEYATNSSGVLGAQTLNLQLDNPQTLHFIMNADYGIADTINQTVSDGATVALQNKIMRLYDIIADQTPAVAHGVLNSGSSTIDEADAVNNEITLKHQVRADNFTGNVHLTAEGYENKDFLNQTFVPGPNTLDGTMTPISTQGIVYFVADNASNFMTMKIKDGSDVLGTYVTNSMGDLTQQGLPMNIPPEGRNLTVEYTHAHGDTETRNIHVTNEEVEDLTHILNHYFTLNHTGEAEGVITYKEGSDVLATGDASTALSFSKRAKTVATNWNASATDATDISGNKTVVPGANSTALDYVWNFRIATSSPDNITGENAQISLGTLVTGNVGSELAFTNTNKTLNSNWSATANGAAAKTGTASLAKGDNALVVDYNWIFSGALNGERLANAIGTVSGSSVFDEDLNSTGDGTYSFEHTNKNVSLDVSQDRGSNFTTSNQNFGVSKGTNNLNLANLLGKYTINFNNVVNGSFGELSSGTLLDSDAAVGNTISHYFENDNENMSLSELITANSYEDYTDNFSATPGVTNRNVSQVPIAGNTYDLSLIITDVTGDILLNGGTLKIEEPDGDIISRTLNGSKYHNVTLEGNFSSSDDFQIWIEKTGYDGLTGTVNQSLKLPLASSWGTKLNVDIAEAMRDDTYVAFMDENTKNNATYMELVAQNGGNHEWNYVNGAGERTQNVVIVTTSMQGEAMDADIKQWYENAFSMHDLYTTDQGLEIMSRTIGYQANIPQTVVPGTIFLMQDDTEIVAGNVKLGNLPENFNAGYTILRKNKDNQNTAHTEFGEGAIPFEDQNSTGENFNAYIQDAQQNLIGVKKIPFRVSTMYDGLTIPDTY